jgi:hypothetical protein
MSLLRKIVSDSGSNMSQSKNPYPTIVKKQMVNTNDIKKYLADGPNAVEATNS